MKASKKLTLLLPGLLLVLFVGACSNGGSSPTQAESLIPEQGEASQEVCHLAQTRIDVLIENLEEHFEHGDWLIGPEVCDGEDNDCDGQIDEGHVCDNPTDN